jgi:hypothetical protein
MLYIQGFVLIRILESLGSSNAIISQFTAVFIVVCFGTAAVTYMHIVVNNVQT